MEVLFSKIYLLCALEFFRICVLTLPNSYYGDLGHAYPSVNESFIIGLCTGQLAAAAVSSSRTVGELIPVAIETVVLALRLGVCVLKIQELVESNKSVSSWSVLVSGIREQEAQELIQKYAEKNVSFYLGRNPKRQELMHFRLCLVFRSPMSVQ